MNQDEFETIGAAMKRMKTEAMLDERRWQEGEARRLRASQNEANRLERYAADVVTVHPRLYCTDCGGTADKPFERLHYRKVIRAGVIYEGWYCSPELAGLQ